MIEHPRSRMEAHRDAPQAFLRRFFAERRMTLSRIHGFWKFVNNLEREETARHLQRFHHPRMRPLARAL